MTVIIINVFSICYSWQLLLAIISKYSGMIFFSMFVFQHEMWAGQGWDKPVAVHLDGSWSCRLMQYVCCTQGFCSFSVQVRSMRQFCAFVCHQCLKAGHSNTMEMLIYWVYFGNMTIDVRFTSSYKKSDLFIIVTLSGCSGVFFSFDESSFRRANKHVEPTYPQIRWNQHYIKVLCVWPVSVLIGKDK